MLRTTTAVKDVLITVVLAHCVLLWLNRVSKILATEWKTQQQIWLYTGEQQLLEDRAALQASEDLLTCRQSQHDHANATEAAKSADQHAQHAKATATVGELQKSLAADRDGLVAQQAQLIKGAFQKSHLSTSCIYTLYKSHLSTPAIMKPKKPPLISGLYTVVCTW